jgi:Kef-type K+ transport system membrane component KefB
MRRLMSLLALTGGLFAIKQYTDYDHSSLESTTISLGFLVLSAYMIGKVFERLRLPKITGYIFSGILFGPGVLNLVSGHNIRDLDFINSMALSLIALSAGAELKLDFLKAYKRSFITIILSQYAIVFIMMFFLILMKSFFSIFNSMSTIEVIAVSMLIGIVSMARSPSTTIAIIDEEQSEGRVTETVLGVTIALDVLVIMTFAIGISMCETIFSPASTMDFSLLLSLMIEIALSIAIGVFLGWLISGYIRRVNAILPIILLTVGFFVAKLSLLFAEHLHVFGIKFEPLLICIACGFYVQNFTDTGKRFLRSLEKVTLIVYTLFFSLSGASIQLSLLRSNWNIALFMFFIRFVSIGSSTTLGAKVARDPKPERRLYWLGFIAQAGVTLGFAHEIARRFPEWGAELACIIIAVISINQIAGPVTFKYALNAAGESRGRKDLSRIIHNLKKTTSL